MQKFVLFRCSFIQFGLMATVFPPNNQNRNAVKQPWEIDLTDRLELISGASAENALTAPGKPFADAASREARSELRPVPDQLFWWRCKADLPTNADPDWPMVIGVGRVASHHGGYHPVGCCSPDLKGRGPSAGMAARARRSSSTVTRESVHHPRFSLGLADTAL